MRITKNTLKRIIKEEMAAIMAEEEQDLDVPDYGLEPTSDFRDYSKEAEREGAPAMAKPLAALNNPEYREHLLPLEKAIMTAAASLDKEVVKNFLIDYGQAIDAPGYAV